MEENYYTAAEIATMLKVNKRSVQRWIKDGKLQGLYIGNHYLVKESELKAFIDNAVTVKPV
jgi:acetyl-CoA synthetase